MKGKVKLQGHADGGSLLSGKAKRDQSLEELKIHIHNSYIPLGRQFMVLFPEGGFLHKRKEISQRFAEKNNLPKLEYVSLPRAGAMKIIMEEIGPLSTRDLGASSSRQARNRDITDDNFNRNNSKMILDTKCGEHIEWILDVTVAYPERVPLHLSDIVCGIRDPCATHLHYRLYPANEVPSDTEGMTRWLYDRFIEKNDMLEEFYRTGRFPSKGDVTYHERPVRQDNLRFLILHLFFIASTIFQYQMFSFIYCYFFC
ncbi:acyl-CoA:lysophosphatidylglycerol acyltransferase 1-like [Phthorimaea operculella]|nr:acyl-CoA:lysophosphatidylglycerol acyltransferase 1-like [Phthorimaea operculella]